MHDCDNGVYFAFHCVPYEVSPDLELFWGELQKQLNSNGYSLLLITTVKLKITTIPHIFVPYMLLEYPELREIESDKNKNNYDYLIRHLMDWYFFEYETASKTFHKVYNFYQSLFNVCKPLGIISWQSMHPISRLCRQLCIEQGIPWWVSERGWVNGTLMIDTHENNFMSELNQSFLSEKIFKNYETNYNILNKFVDRVSSAKSIARYPNSLNCIDDVDLKNRLGIPAGSKVYTFCAHGEPHICAANTFHSIQRQHQLTFSKLQSNLKSVADFLASRGDYLLVKEHPFNTIHDRELSLEGFQNTIKVDAAIDDLITISDHFLFTVSTIQFDLFLMNKSFGLLSNGILSGINEAPNISDFTDVHHFINEIENECNWRVRKIGIDKKISYLLDYFLYEIGEDSNKVSIAAILPLLLKFTGDNSFDLSKSLESLKNRYRFYLGKNNFEIYY
jgi:hypothetical protein